MLPTINYDYWPLKPVENYKVSLFTVDNCIICIMPYLNISNKNNETVYNYKYIISTNNDIRIIKNIKILCYGHGRFKISGTFNGKYAFQIHYISKNHC